MFCGYSWSLVCCVVNKIAFNIFLGFQILMRFPTAAAAAAASDSPYCLPTALSCIQFMAAVLHLP